MTSGQYVIFILFLCFCAGVMQIEKITKRNGDYWFLWRLQQVQTCYIFYESHFRNFGKLFALSHELIALYDTSLDMDM